MSAFAGAGLLAACSTDDRAADICAPAEGLQFICGTGAVEDLAPIADTRWLIGGNLNIGNLAHLQLVDGEALTVSALEPDFTADSAIAGNCEGAPDASRWSISGLAADERTLFVTNHGDRMAVELFTIDNPGETSGDSPTLRWTGCVLMPAYTLPNAVTPDGEGGFYVVSFHDPDDGAAFARMAAGEATGSVWHWSQMEGLQPVEMGPLVGGNGIALSPEGKLYVSAWGAREIVALDLATGERSVVPLHFMPDNLHFAGDGALLVAGQGGSVADIGACGPSCPQPWVVARVDPATQAVETLASGEGSPIVDYAVGAVEADGRVWVTVRGADRLALLPR